MLPKVTERSPGPRRIARALVALALAGCTTSTDPFSPLTVDGTVTRNGAPAPAEITLTAGNFRTSKIFPDGSFSLTVGGGGVPQSNCSSATVEAAVLDEDGRPGERESRFLGGCGAYTVDFEF